MKKGEFLRKGLAMLLALVMIIGFLPGVGSIEVSAEEGSTSGANTIKCTEPEGDGTAEKPYQIGTAAELYWFVGLVNGTLSDGKQNTSAHAVLTKNISVNKNVLKSDGTLNDESFIQWIPIGDGNYQQEEKIFNSFTGIFDGQNHTISGLYLDDEDAENVGLFGCVDPKANISNVGVVDSYFNGNYFVGGICGSGYQCTITNCYNIGTVKGKEYVGGVCGQNNRGTITDCYNAGKVKSPALVGGICGNNDEGTIENCYNTGDVDGLSDNSNSSYFGGVCGSNEGTIKNCYNTGTIKGVSTVGGVSGNNGGTIENCYHTGEVNGSNERDNIGGVCGSNKGTIKNCYHTGNIKGKTYVGGVCGYNDGGTIENCYHIGNVEGSSFYVGGVCGNNDGGTIQNCYNIGEVSVSSSDPSVGGVCGYNNGTIENCYYDNDVYTGNGIGVNSENAIKEDAFDIATKEMHTEAFCKGIWFESYQNGICALCGVAYQPAELTKGKYKLNLDGDEEKDDVYEISNAGQLYWFAGLVNGTLEGVDKNTSANAVLTKDIVVNTGVLDEEGDLVSNTNEFTKWTPIGDGIYQPETGIVNSFTGIFDGQNHTISGLYFDFVDKNYVGLFGRVLHGKVVNVGIQDSYFNGYEHVGGVCGYNNMGSTIENCYNTGRVNGSSAYVGGVCGYNCHIIQNCYNTGIVKGSRLVGGICGYNSGTIENCYNTGAVRSGSDSDCIGRICGMNVNNGIIKNCYYMNSDSEGKAIGSEGGSVEKVAVKTIAEFNSGEVAYLLQKGQEEQEDPTEVVWGQTLTGDNKQDFPVLGGIRVNKIKKYEGCEGARGTPTEIYSNSGKDEFEPHKDDGSTKDSVAYDNICDVCGKAAHHFVKGVCTDCGYHKGTITNDSYVTKIAYRGAATNAEPKASDFVVASGQKPAFTWYQGDVTTGELPKEALLDAAPKEVGTYTLVVRVDGIEQEDDTVYTAAELPLKVTIEKEALAGIVSLNGTAKYGETLTVVTTGIKNNDPGAFSYQWYRVDGQDAAAIIGATGVSYTITEADVGKKVKVVVSSAYCDGSLEAVTENTVNKMTEVPPKTEEVTTQQPKEEATAPQPQDPKNGDVIADGKTNAKYEVTDAVKKEVAYKAPINPKAKSITVPDTITINGEIYKVTKISDNAFRNNKTVTTITIGSNVNTIGKYAFKSCKKLKTIIIKSKKLTTKTVSKKAFKGISKKVVIKVPKKKLSAYKKLLRKKGLSSKNKIQG